MIFQNRSLIILIFMVVLAGSISMINVFGGVVSGGPVLCADYSKYIDDDVEYRKIVEWADKEVFSRKLQESEFVSGNFSGPGLRHYTIDAERSGIVVPEWLSDYEIRALGENLPDFSAIFIGGGKYQGLVISRGEWNHSINAKIIADREIKKRNNRVGLVCYVEP